MKKLYFICLLALAGCAYHNPLDKAGLRFQTLNTPPYVLSSWYRVDEEGAPLTVYVEKEQIDDEQRDAAVADKSKNVAYLARPCQYFQTDACDINMDTQKEKKSIQKAIRQLQKKANTDTVVVKGL